MQTIECDLETDQAATILGEIESGFGMKKTESSLPTIAGKNPHQNFIALKESTKALLMIAGGNTHSSTAAALTLLSAFDSDAFSLPLRELRQLDGENFKHAAKVIESTWDGLSPHQTLDQGEDLFIELSNQWKHEANK